MKKWISVIVTVLFVSTMSHAQLDPDKTARSLVKVKVSGAEKINVCSGFLWKKDTWVVTSLHAMQKNATVEIQYLNNYWRDAKVIKVLPEADLVLLEVDLASNPLPETATAIKTYSKAKVMFPEKLYAQGYHGGAHGHRTQAVEKGNANPETLEYIVVKEENKQLLYNVGVPRIDLPILYLNGSLLPGYSGAPIYNLKGELVAIGDGGLEGGQVNVSWAIPATYLTQLEQSANSKLPDNIDQISLLFSAQLQVETASVSHGNIQESLDAKYTSYTSGPFEFYKTKNRSFEDMYLTSLDPENLDYFAEEFYENNLIIDYKTLSFDIYEDVNNGVIIALPEDSRLVYQSETESFAVDMSNYPLSQYFTLEFAGLHDQDGAVEDVDVAVDLLLDQVNLAYGSMVGGFYEDEDYSYSIEVDEDYEIAYILYSGNTFYVDESQNSYDLKMYLTVLHKYDQVFYTMSTISLPVYQLAGAFNNGIDCIDNYEGNTDYCDFFEGLMRVVAASHLTTFANKQFISNQH